MSYDNSSSRISFDRYEAVKLGIGWKQSLQPCVLCFSMKEGINEARNKGHIEREKMLNVLLQGHIRACHNLN